jgi:hypothetical protein
MLMYICSGFRSLGLSLIDMFARRAQLSSCDVGSSYSVYASAVMLVIAGHFPSLHQKCSFACGVILAGWSKCVFTQQYPAVLHQPDARRA